MKGISDDICIKNISRSKWFKTLDYYPKTIGHFKILASILDRIGILNNFDITEICNMEESKLDIIYAILRIENKIFNTYIDHVVKKIYIIHMKKIFVCDDFQHYDMFIDQLVQDIDYFVSSIIYCCNKMDEVDVKNRFINYLDLTFSNDFYNSIIRKLPYSIDNDFYEKHDKIFTHMSKKFVKYTYITLIKTRQKMETLLRKIFDSKCSHETISEIVMFLKKNVNIKKLFVEQCIEIDIYHEQILNELLNRVFDEDYNKNDKNLSLEVKNQEIQMITA
jgi:hypothetical protein